MIRAMTPRWKLRPPQKNLSNTKMKDSTLTDRWQNGILKIKTKKVNGAAVILARQKHRGVLAHFGAFISAPRHACMGQKTLVAVSLRILFSCKGSKLELQTSELHYCC
jgi:hypothetical protein